MNDPSLTSLLRRWEEALPHRQGPSSEPPGADHAELLDEVRRGIEILLQVRQRLGLPPDAAETAGQPKTVTPPGSPSAAQASESLAPPGYEVLGELSRGGMGVVYRARQQALNRPCALKMILAGGHAGPGDRDRFLAEAKAVARVKHTGIVQVYDFGTHNGLPFFSLELCEGGSLAGKLREGPLKAAEAAGLVEQIARAVQAAHQAGIVHRDLKPANVLLADDGSPRVTDFGLAKRIEGGGQTQTGAVLGTPSYMAPEQARAEKDVGPAADVWALGAILYECLTGRPPFRAATPLDTVLQVIANEPVPLRQLDGTVPVDLETICHKCLQKDAARRYASARELAEDLHRFTMGRPIVARPVGRLERLVRWCRREPVVAGLLGAILGLTLGAVGVIGKLYADARAETRRALLATDAAARDRDAALLAETKVERERDAARRSAEQARTQEQEARQQQRLAGTERERAQRQKHLAEVRLYASQIQAAQREWQAGQPDLAWEHLDRCRWDFRHFEHRYLQTLFNQNQVVLQQQTRPVGGVAFSPDGRRIASASHDGTVKVFDATTGAVTGTLPGPAGAAVSVAFSGDGKRVVSGGGETGKRGEVKVCDATTGMVLRTIPAGSDVVVCLALSPDGKLLAAGGRDGTMRVWDRETGRLLISRKLERGAAGGLAFSPDGRRIVLSGWAGAVVVWEVGTGQQVLRLDAGGNAAASVVFSPDGKHIVAGLGHLVFINRPGEIRIWDASTGQLLRSLHGHAEFVITVAVSPDGTRIASGSKDRTLRVWDLATGRQQAAFHGHTGYVMAVAWSPDGQRIVSAGTDGTSRVWDTTGSPGPLTLTGKTALVHGAVVSADGQRIVAASGDNTLTIWDAATGWKPRFLVGHTGAVTCVALSSDGKRIASGSEDKTVRLWDADTGRESSRLDGHSDRINGVALSGDGKRVVSASRDGTLKVWDVGTSKPLTLAGHARGVSAVAVSADGRRIISSGGDHNLKVWDAGTGWKPRTLSGHTQPIRSAATSSDGRRIVSGGDDGRLKVWDADSGRELLSLQGHTGPIFSVAFSADGKRLLSGSLDRTVKVWDAGTGEELLTLKGHGSYVLSVAMTEDGRRIVTSSYDGTVMVWEANVDDWPLRLRGHGDAFRGVAVSRHGDRIFARDRSGKVLAWDARSGELLADPPDRIPAIPDQQTATGGRVRAVVDGALIRVEIQPEFSEARKRRQARARAILQRLARPDPAYHRRQADRLAKAGDLFAAAFHLRRLLLAEPKDGATRKRLAAVEALLQAEPPLPEKRPAKMPRAR